MPGGVRRDDGREPTLGGGERYTEPQLVEILRRAAERQEGLTTEPDGRFSLAEIQQIASEVGIAPAHVAAAAVEVMHSSAPPPPSALGAPTSFRFERWLDGEIPRSAIGELFDIARREVGLQGQVSEALDTVEWRARSHLGASVVSVATRSGRTKISVYHAPTDAAALVAVTTSVGGVGGAVAIGLALGTTAAVAGPLAIAATVAVSLGWAGAGSWVAMRGIWRRLARRWEERANALGTRLVDAAQRAIDGARTDNE
jgi:hypothetical protein